MHYFTKYTDNRKFFHACVDMILALWFLSPSEMWRVNATSLAQDTLNSVVLLC